MAQYPIESRFRPTNPVLQDIVSGLANDPGKFVAQAVLPAIDVAGESSGTIMTLAAGDMFGNPDADFARALGATAHESRGVELGNTTYRVAEYAAMVPADWKQLSRAQLPAQVELKSLLLAKLMADLFIAQEVRMAELFLANAAGTPATGTWTLNTTPATKWDAATSDPLSDIELGVESVAGFGLDANTMLIGRGARRSLQKNDSFLEFLPVNSDRGFMESSAVKARLASLYGVPADRIFYLDAQRNTASPGQTPVLANIGDDEMWIGHISGSGVQLAGGVTLQPTAAARFVEQEFKVEEWDDPARNSVWQKVSHAEVAQVVTASLGYLIHTTNT
jgi:hypothetical protein